MILIVITIMLMIPVFIERIAIIVMVYIVKAYKVMAYKVMGVASVRLVIIIDTMPLLLLLLLLVPLRLPLRLLRPLR